MEKITQPRKKNPFYQKRDQDVRYRCQVLGESDGDIAAAWGMSEHSLRSLRRRLGIRPTKTGTSKSGAKRNHRLMVPLSQIHHQIGVKLDLHRATVAKQPALEFAHKMRVSSMRLRKMELGTWDFTLSDLIKISGMLGLPLEELVKLANPPCWQQPEATRRPSAH